MFWGRNVLLSEHRASGWCGFALNCGNSTSLELFWPWNGALTLCWLEWCKSFFLPPAATESKACSAVTESPWLLCCVAVCFGHYWTAKCCQCPPAAEKQWCGPAGGSAVLASMQLCCSGQLLLRICTGQIRYDEWSIVPFGPYKLILENEYFGAFQITSLHIKLSGSYRASCVHCKAPQKCRACS